MTRALALLCCVVAMMLATAKPAWAAPWIENHVLADEIRVTVERSGKATVEHRVRMKLNGNVRQRRLTFVGVDEDATPLDNSYVVPARDAASSSLESAIPLKLTVQRSPPPMPGEDAKPTKLKLELDTKRGILRGRYVFVVRYTTDLLGRGLIQRDGALLELRWHGPLWDDGYDNARTTFVLPAAPTPPIPVERPMTSLDDDDDEQLAPTYLSEVRRGHETDEVELLRTYAPRRTRVPWAVRVDQRALAAPPKRVAPEPATVASPPPVAETLLPERIRLGIAAGLFLFILLATALRGHEVRKHAEAAGAEMPPVVPLPFWARAPLAAAAYVGGLHLQLLMGRPLEATACILAATLLVCHRTAVVDAKAALRGPGRWLPVSEAEVFEGLPRPKGAVLDVSTRLGKVVFVAILGVHGGAVAWLSQSAPQLALQLGFDAVIWLGLCGTGKMNALPPDLAVEPARFLKRLVARVRKQKGTSDLRMVPKIRIPSGEVDADELRLWVAPRLPLRGFTSIEVGVMYAIGTGARVAMPGVLVRVVAGSPCEEALAPIAARARVTPGRKPDERVIALTPRFPNVRMTAEIVVALAARVTDREAPRAKRPRRKKKVARESLAA